MYVLLRTIKTFLDCMISGVLLQIVYQPFDKRIIFLIALGAALISFTVNSIFGVPENCNDGTLYIDDTASDRTKWTFSIEKDPERIALRNSIHLKVKEFKEIEGRKQ